MENRKGWYNLSNLGGYQQLTTVAKRVGGPINLVGINLLAGAVILKGGEIAFKKIKNKINQKEIQEASDLIIYSVIVDGVSNEGLEFKIGDQFRVLKTDKGAVLIEKIGDDNNPYFVSEEMLKNISNYKH